MPVTDQEKAAKARDAALQGALTQIEREFGKGTVMRMGDEGAQVRCEAIPTGALSLDLALGIGGVPRGRIVEVFGPGARHRSPGPDRATALRWVSPRSAPGRPRRPCA